MIIFETERLIVRQYTADEFENFYLLNSDEEIMRFIRPVQDRDASGNFFKEIISAYADAPSIGRWSVNLKTTGEFIGSFAIIPIPWDKNKIQLGYALVKNFWGKGFATELTVKGLEYFWNSASVSKIYGVTEVPNTASQKVLLKAGFQIENQLTENGKEIFVYSCCRKVEVPTTSSD